ncbi:glycoside hydrolase family 11 protein [Sphingomonas sp. CJ99]
MTFKGRMMIALTRVLPMAAVGVLGSMAMTGTAQAQTICSNSTGNQGGYFWTFFRDSGSGCMTLGANGNFSVNWQLGGSGNLVVGKGWATGSTTRRIGYNAGVFNAGNNGYLTLYGWTTNPLVEYYVVDNWGNFTPPGNAAQLGTVNTDGGTYRIYRTQRVNAPSIIGNATFYQYWSVRTQKRATGQNHTITFANHVNAWRNAGMNLGQMNYQVMAAEGFGSNGSANITVWQQ